MVGCVIQYNRGLIFVLPQYKNNEYIINLFLNRILPKIYQLETKSNLISQFVTPKQLHCQKKFEEANKQIKIFEENIEKIRADFNEAIREKENILKNDETSALIINYYNLALQQEEVALFYLYKVVEAIEKNYKSEKIAKSKLGHNTEWNLIGKTANASYGDIRHAPKPGEVIREISQEDLHSCYDAAVKIIFAYFKTLF
jgi:hypothetical protein